LQNKFKSFFFILSSHFNVEMTVVEDEWSLCYDAQLDSLDIGSLSEYEIFTSKTRESSDEDNQSELSQNYGRGRGRRRGHGRGRPRGNGRESTTPPRPIWSESILQLVIHD
jgi:hypothetical protein